MAADQEPNWGRFASLGFEVAAGVAIGVIVGHWLDRRYGWTPWGVLVGGLLGMVAGMYLLIKSAREMNR